MSINPVEKIMPEPSYSADDIVVLSGLEAVRRRPGMYVGDMGDGSALCQMVHSAVENAVEWLGSDCGRITVTLNPDESVTVEDNGHGMPTDMHPREDIPVVEFIMTRLLCGGNRKAAKGYPGQYHTGIAVTNALSSHLDLTIWRADKQYAMTFACGVAETPLEVVGDVRGRSGTRITFLPCNGIFSSTVLDYARLERELREVAFFHDGIHFELTDRRSTETKSTELHYGGGLRDFVRYLDLARTSLLREPIVAKAETYGATVEAAFWWNSSTETHLLDYISCSRQIEGSARPLGFLGALTEAINDCIGMTGIAPAITDDDVRKGLTGVVSVTMDDWPRFDGLTRDGLASPYVHPAVQNAVSHALHIWLATHPNDAKAILRKIVASARRREAGEQLAGALARISSE